MIDNLSFPEKNASKIELLSYARSKIYHSKTLPKIIGFFYKFNSFNGNGIKDFDYSMSIKFSLEKSFYTLKPMHGKKEIRKKYNKLLRKEEFQEVIRAETKAHTDYINQQIEKAQQKIE